MFSTRVGGSPTAPRGIVRHRSAAAIRASQRVSQAADVAWLSALSTVSKAPGGSLKQVMLELVKSDAFRTHLGGTP